ncbi:MAG TPA: hypothetical protein VKW04_22730 [Planctomycetota bacterium]|nr:hypothetical protein [Planctomycetota bacterium]
MMVLLASLAVFAADVYYVSPRGDDANDGKSEAKAWRSAAKVNAASFKPGDQILFARGGEWRECLRASSSGGAGTPIVYAAYGKGEKPKFWGSDPVTVGADGTANSEKPVAALLADHRFLAPGTWSWANGILKAKPGTYTACVRVDLVFSNGKNHLVFRDLAADESADVRDGYGFRVMGSDDVRLEDCEAYRAGRHHFGAINSTGFVGLRLTCAHAMPAIPGGATFYVSFSDAARKNDTHQWIDCTAEHLENPGQRNYQVFYDHGEGLGPILIQNLTSRGGMFSVGSSSAAPVTVKGGLIEDAGLEVFGDHFHADGLTIQGNGAVDLWCSDSVVENLLLLVDPKNGGPTGYGAGCVLREGAKRNLIRYSTLILGDAPCFVVLKPDSGTKIQGNVLRSKKGVFGNENAALLEGNFSAGEPGLDAQYRPKPGSPIIAAGKIEHPDHDHAGRPRPSPCALGAFEPGK